MTRTNLILPGFLALAAFFLVPSDAVAGMSTYKPSSVGATLEVSISESGRVSVSGARVREVTDSGFVAETLWGAGKLSWTVKTGENTPIVRKSGGRITLTDVTAGDYVSFSGVIQSNMAPFTVEADQVRDFSINDNHAVFSGTVSAIDREARTLTLTTAKGGTVTVRTSTDTAYAQSGAQSFADLSVGDTVIVAGSRSTASSLTAAKVNVTERAIAKEKARPVIATGLGSWVDSFLPRFFVGRIH